MKKKTNFISWIIIGITLPLLGTLAWNQFNWLQVLQNREKNRIEFSMVSSSQGLSKRLQEEILFLPSLLRIRQEEQGQLDAIFNERYQFWHYYALFPSIVTGIFLLDAAEETFSQWYPDGFVPPQNSLQKTDIINFSETKKFGDSRIEDTETEIRILIPVYGTKEREKMVLCIFDKEILFRDVLPLIADSSLESSDLYAYRIIDTRNNSLVYTSVKNYTDELFQNPDIEFPVFEQIHFPSFRQPPDFLTRRLPEKYYESFSFIKERTKIETDQQPDENQAPLFSYLVLQIVNKDGSLITLSKKATIQNALISFGAVILLALVMLLLAEATRRSRALARSQQEFIATITHELKTPLAVISSAAQNLADGLIPDPKKVGQYGTMIKKESDRLGMSIEHFLLYSNINSAARVRPTLCDILEILETVLKFTEEERQRYEFRTEVSLPEQPVFINGDKVALESVFQNLVQNVLKHARDGKYLGIIVSFEAENRKNHHKRIIIKVRDKGEGISSSEQKLIFEPFTRGKRAIDSQIPGNGIGLNLVKRIVAMHEGTITVESKIDQGSTFIVSLPAE